MRASFPDWDSVKEEMYKISEMSDGIRADLPEGQYDTDYFKPDGSDRYDLPVWFSHWYAYTQPVIDALKPELARIYALGPSVLWRSMEDSSIWAQKYSRNSTHGGHNHGYGSISACQYIKFDPAHHQATCFHHLPPSPFTGITESFTPEVEEGDIVFFPSTYMHSSNVNTSSKERLIVAWNMEVFRASEELNP